jgi:hypothetical protein
LLVSSDAAVDCNLQTKLISQFIVISFIQIYMGKQPYRSLNVTFDRNVGFILDRVSASDAGTYRCKAEERAYYYSSYSYYDSRLRVLGLDYLKFSLDVSKYFTDRRVCHCVVLGCQ